MRGWDSLFFSLQVRGACCLEHPQGNWARFLHIFSVPTLSLTLGCRRRVAVPPERVELSSQLCWWKSRDCFGSILGFNLCLALATMGADPVRRWVLLLKLKVLVMILHTLLFSLLHTHWFNWGCYWFTPARDLSTARAAAERSDLHGGLGWWFVYEKPIWGRKAGAVITQTARLLQLRPVCQQQQHNAPSESNLLRKAGDERRQQSMSRTPASFQPARVFCSCLIHSVARLRSSLVSGAIQRCRRKPTGTSWELWHRPHWHQKPTARYYLLPLFIPMVFPSSSQLLI